MIVLFSFFLILLFSIFRTNSKYISFFFSTFFVISLICAAGFRNGGYDYINYVNGYNWNSFREPFFRLLVSFLHSISATYRLFFVIVATATVSLSFNFIKKNEKGLYWLSLLIFVSNYYLQHDYIQLRIGLACAIFLYQLYYINNGQKKIAMLLWVLSCCCHFSMILTVITFFVNNKKITNIEALFCFVLFVLLFSLAIKKISIVSIAEKIPGISYYYKIYMELQDNGEGSSINVFNPIYLLRYFIFFLCLIKRKTLLKYDNNINFYLRLYFIGIMIFLALTGIPAFAFRGSEIFFITELLIYPLTKYLFVNKNIGNIFVVLIALFFFVINVFHNNFLNLGL